VIKLFTASADAPFVFENGIAFIPLLQKLLLTAAPLLIKAF
jgi:hypothetical protein